MSQQTAPYSSRAFNGTVTILYLLEGLEQEMLAASWKARLNKEHLHSFQVVPLPQSHK